MERCEDTMAKYQPGCLLIRVEGDTARFINRCAEEEISAERFCSTDGVLFGYIPQKDYKQTRFLAEQLGCELSVLEKDGVSCTLSRYRRRLGLIVWPAVLTGALLFSQCFAWALTVNGLSQVDRTLILDAAEDAGLRIGSFLPSVDMQAVADHILETIPGVGYCAVNKIGSHVEIEINEAAQIPTVLPDDPCSVIAAETGTIVYLEVYNGQESVKVGETVGKGQQIVSGITESADGKTRYVHASALVLADAKFTREFTLDIKQLEREYLDEKEVRWSVELFGKAIPLYLPDGVKKAAGQAVKAAEQLTGFLFSGPESSEQTEDEQDVLWEETVTRQPLTIAGVQLPIGMIKNLRESYTESEKNFSEEEALAQLQQAAAAWETENLADGEILSREEKMTVDDGVATLTVDYLCRMDIASPKKIEVTFDEEQSEETSDSAG